MVFWQSKNQIKIFSKNFFSVLLREKRVIKLQIPAKKPRYNGNTTVFQTRFLALKRYFLWFFSLKSESRPKMQWNQKKNGLKIFVFNGFQFFRFFEKINFSLKNWNPLKTKIFRPFFFWFHCIFGLDSDFNEKNHKKYRFSAKKRVWNMRFQPFFKF